MEIVYTSIHITVTILTDMMVEYNQVDTHVQKFNRQKFGYHKYLHIRVSRVLNFLLIKPTFLRYISIDGDPDITPIQGGMMADKDQSLVVGWNLLTHVSAFSMAEILCITHLIFGNHYEPHTGRCSVTLVHGGMIADYNPTDIYVLKFNRDKFGCTKPLPIRASRVGVFFQDDSPSLSPYKCLQLRATTGGRETYMACACTYIFMFPNITADID